MRSPRIKIHGRKYTARLLEREFGISPRTARDWVRKGSDWVKAHAVKYKQIPSGSYIKAWKDYRASNRYIAQVMDERGYRTADIPPRYKRSPRYHRIEDKPWDGQGYIYVLVKLMYGSDVHYATVIYEAPYGPDVPGSQRRLRTFENAIEEAYLVYANEREAPQIAGIWSMDPKS
jgi:hypothetical protein